MKKLKSQSGRSMVEMLGVLAIIGVLSVGGIAGYSLSMRRHRANGIADIASKYALVAYNQCQQKILNGELSAVSSCGGSNLISFEDAGIGAVPSGLQTNIGIQLLGIGTDTGTGIDTVNIGFRFKDFKLCQAVASVIGTGCNSNYVQFSIKQN